MSVQHPGRRLGLSALVGVLLGLALWSVVEDGDSVREPRASAAPGPARAAGEYVPPLPSTSGSARERRDGRPPHAPRVPATPPRLEIPGIGVRAHISPLGKTASGGLDVPHNWSVVGRWNGGAKPGSPGVAVLVGHVDSQTRPAVFHRLGKLRPGDLIRYVGRDRSVTRFVVVRTAQAPKANFPTTRVYRETREPSLRLITCGGSFDWSRGHYRDNVIVYATRVRVGRAGNRP